MDGIAYALDNNGVDWARLKSDLAVDRFDNGRSAAALECSFRASAAVCFARNEDGQVIGTARVLSDGVCNAYIVDVWTRADCRRRGIGSEMMRRLLDLLPGQHVALFTAPEAKSFYKALGFEPESNAMELIVGTWLQNPANASG